jgi:hypothetical protein
VSALDAAPLLFIAVIAPAPPWRALGRVHPERQRKEATMASPSTIDAAAHTRPNTDRNRGARLAAEMTLDCVHLDRRLERTLAKAHTENRRLGNDLAEMTPHA